MSNTDVTTGPQGARNANFKQFNPRTILKATFDELVGELGVDKESMYPHFRERLEVAIKRQPLYLETIINYWFDNHWRSMTLGHDEPQAPNAPTPAAPKRAEKTQAEKEASKKENERLQQEITKQLNLHIQRKADAGIKNFFKYLQTLNREDALDRLDATHTGARTLIVALPPGASVGEIALDDFLKAYAAA